MNNNSPIPTSKPAKLRRQAEARLRQQRPAASGQRSALGVEQMLHELQVHQIELEMQNEELRRAQVDLDALRARYFDLYDLAPVGYFTLSDKGLILEANLTASTLLGERKKRLVARPLSQFIVPADKDQYYFRYKALRLTGEQQTWMLRLVKVDGTIFWGELDAVATMDSDGAQICRVTLTDRTRRKQAEETLRVSEEQLSLFIAHAPAAVAMFDTQMRYILASQRWVLDYGLHGQDLRGRSHYEVFPEIPERWKAIHRRCLAGQVERAEEDPFVRADGSTQWVKWEIRPWQTKAGSVGGIVILSEDITARKVAEAALREIQERFRVVQDLSPDGFTILRPVRDAVGRVVDFTWVYENAAIARLNGTTPEQVVGRRLLEIFPRHRESPFLKAYQQVAESGKSCIFEADYQGESIEKRTWFRIAVVAAGGDIAILGQDITARKQAEAVLSESEFRWKFALESAGDGLWDWDILAGTVLYSRQWKAMLGYAEKEIGKGLAEWRSRIHPEDLERTLAALQAHCDGNTPLYHSEHRLRCRDGSWKWILDRGVIVGRDPVGRPVRMIGTHVDITARKQAEELGQLFAQEVVRAREVERKTLAASLHHDVGSMAVGVSAALAALAADLYAGKLAAGLQRVQQVQQLFLEGVARLKGVATQLRPPELDVIGLRSALRQHCAQLAMQTGIRIHLTAPPSRQPIPSDLATILFRVAQEALTNAIKHGRAKRIAVLLRAGPPGATLAVRDNGTGFDPAPQPLQPTSQLGLRVMREMVASVGGTFTVESEPGHGTLVRVRVPVGAAAKRGRPGRSARSKSRPSSARGA